MPSNYPECCKTCTLKDETTCKLCHKLSDELDAIEAKLEVQWKARKTL